MTSMNEWLLRAEQGKPICSKWQQLQAAWQTLGRLCELWAELTHLEFDQPDKWASS